MNQTIRDLGWLAGFVALPVILGLAIGLAAGR